MRQRGVVNDGWGFAAKHARGLGLTALFAGASGTGKTMAAEILAAELDLDLYQVDLASVVSKYIGETEKNLRAIFDGAEQSGAILLFDEADALFGKRSEVRDSHDRYANLEISYLLQQMESYRGVAILTTNMHLRAAAIVGGQEALAHRVAAAADPDAELASDLCAAAAAAADAGQLLLAARYLQQAAAQTARGPDRDERALSAFELLVRAADVAAAEAARPVIEQLPASARRDTALGQLALLAARPADAEALLRAAWDAHDRVHQASVGGEAALGLGMLLKMSGAHAEAAAWLDRALGSGAGSEPWYDAARCIRSFAFVLTGDVGSALGLFGDLPARSASAPAARTDALTFRGVARLWAGDLPAAAADLAEVVSRISAGVPVRFGCRAPAFLAETEFRLGGWDDARGHAELAVALAADADRAYDLALVHSAAVPVAACRGDWAAADGHARAAEQAARTFGGLAAILAASARGILGLARDDPEEVLHGADLALAVPQIDHYDPAAFWWRPAQVWALIRTGHLGQAEAILAATEARAGHRGDARGILPGPRGCVARWPWPAVLSTRPTRCCGPPAARLAAGSCRSIAGCWIFSTAGACPGYSGTEPPPMR